MMLVTFATGVAFAIGHHFFYQSLDGTQVDNATFDQQINTAVGTAFTFLVRSFLTVAVGVAFVQVLWRRLKSKHITVSRIDSMTQLLTSLFDLLNLKTLWQHPLLAFLAIISWTLPIAAVIPPASLSVRNPINSRLEYTTKDLPLPDFTKSTFAKIDFTMSFGLTQLFCFRGSSDELAQLALGTAVQGEITSKKAPAPNSSYSLQFYGPSIRCEQTPTAMLRGFDAVFGCDFAADSSTNYTESCIAQYRYLAWTPTDIARIPFQSMIGDTYDLDFRHVSGGGCAQLATAGGLANYTGEPTTIYIATSNFGSHLSWSLLNCSLYNASYTTKIDYEEGIETISTKTRALNNLPFLGAEEPQHPIQVANPPVPEATKVRMNYQAVMDTFGKILVGGIYDIMAMYEPGTIIYSTSILSTNLRNCAELGGNDSTVSLARAAEQLFENITLSLFSKSDYVSTNGSSFKPTNVTLFTYPNIYVYSWGRLALAYGLAIFFTALAVLLGGLALLASNESYNYTFSTIMRVTRQKIIDNIIRQEDTNGEDPLPKHIAKTCIIAGRQQGNNQEDQSMAESHDGPRLSMQETQPTTHGDLHGDDDIAHGREGQSSEGSGQPMSTGVELSPGNDSQPRHARDSETHSSVSEVSSRNEHEDWRSAPQLSRQPSEVSRQDEREERY